MKKNVIIVGGVAGGASAAARLRRLSEEIEITVFERGHYVSFANCGLPYYVGGKIKERSQLELMAPEDFLDRFNINVKVNHEVLSIDRSNKTVNVKDVKTGNILHFDYNYLVLSPGASPIVPPFTGIKDVPTFTLRTIPDSVKIRDFIEKKNVNHATIVGGGYIGLEMAENLKKKGVKVKIVEMLDQVLSPIDKEMAQLVHQELILNGVCLQLGDPVNSFVCDENNCNYVIPKSGKKIKTDLIILAIGVKPENKLAKDAGLEIGPKGHIIVDDHMQTSDDSIFAVGDAVQVKQYQTLGPTAIPLAGPANKQGRIAANNIAGRQSKYKGILGASVLKVFDMTASFVGLNEKQLKKSQKQYEKVYIHPNNHTGYYPGAVPISLKLLFEVPSGKVLGAQAVGGNGTDKRIDVISTVIKYGGTVYDLEELELTYAPPYGSAKDPINMAGFVASNVLKGDMPIWHWHDLEEIKENNNIFIDVRSEEEFAVGAIDNAKHIHYTELREKIDEIPKDKNLYIYCEVGFRGYLVTRVLKQLGFDNVYNLTGGYKTLKTASATTEEIAEACGPSEEIMEEMIEKKSTETKEFIQVDACGLSCPGPLNALVKGIEKLPEGKSLKIFATDPGFKSSVEAYVKLNEQHIELMKLGKEEGKLMAILKKKHLISDEQIKAPVKIEKKTRKEQRGENAPPITEISPEEFFERFGSENGPRLVCDVRTQEEYNGIGGYIKGSKNIPLGDLVNNLEQLKEYKDEEIVVLCAVGGRSMMAAQLLARVGYKDIRNLTGGLSLYRKKGFPIERRRDY